MVENRPVRSLCPGIAYHDYLVLTCCMDEEWSMRGADSDREDRSEMLLRGWQLFAAKCRKYRAGIDKNYRAFCSGNGTRATDFVSTYLFDPLIYKPLGHSDSMGIVLLDDFDPVHFLTSDIRTTVEEVSLGLCPVVESFCPTDARSVVLDFHTLLSAGGQSLTAPKGKRRARRRCAAHAFQAVTPLLVFTKYKLDGLGVLGAGLLFQQAVFRAMASRVLNVLNLLRDATQQDGSVSALVDEGGRQEDVNRTKCVFLDLQGVEEVGTLIF